MNYTKGTISYKRRKIRETFSGESISMAKIFSGLAHPIRLRILELLLEKSMNVNSLMKELKYAQSTVSDNLKQLRSCGLIGCVVKGTSNIYYINEDVLGLVKDYLRKL